MISVKLMGGLGNQLFQIFATMAYSIRNNVEIGLNKTEVVGKRSTYWNNLFRGIQTSDILVCEEDYRELNFTYSELPKFHKSTKLVGYFQSYKYFENEYKCIIDTMNLSNLQEEAKKHSLHNGIGIHFRLGDYKNIQEYHMLMPYEYYKSAMIHLNKKDDVFYFCEEEDNEAVDEIVKSLAVEFGNKFIKVPDYLKDWEQLLIMSCCNDNIIANSTYSWWGAYFNNNPNKTVCYPGTWFGPKINHSTIDLFPESWQRIKL